MNANALTSLFPLAGLLFITNCMNIILKKNDLLSYSFTASSLPHLAIDDSFLY
ncbi:Protein of unknown function [Bacillus mycoides]|nr:Protein of unknown function [Bacillus mycoides]